MSWYKDLRISVKLVSGFVMVAAIAAAVGGVGITQIRKIESADAMMYEKFTVPLGQAGDLAVAFQRMRVNLRDMLNATNRQEQDRFQQRIVDLRAEVDKSAAEFEKSILSDEARRLYNDFVEAKKQYGVILDRIIQLKAKDKGYEMKALIEGDMAKAARAEMDAVLELLKFKAGYAKSHPDAAQIEGLADIADLSTTFQRIRVNARELLLADTKAAVNQAVDKIRGYREQIKERQVKYEKSVVTDEERRLFQSFVVAANAYGPMLDKVIDFAGQSEDEAIRQVVAGDGARFARAEQEAIEKLVEKKVRDANRTAEQNAATADSAATLMVAFVVVGVLVAIALGVFISRMISSALVAAVGVAEKVATGDLDVSITVDRKDETGQLMLAMHHMHGKLTEIVGQVRVASDAIASAASEIAQGNADLSQRTEEQASSLEETASSMEELTSTVKQNADNAQQANQLAAQARREAEQGGNVARQAVTAMGEISASSKKIADIIGVIDEIAFQTNLLALNAAVEAARAGEQGRGFAVVAGEVRNLAQRSADSAKQIKELITASVAKVEEGSKYVDATGVALDEIVGAVKKVTDVMAEIAAASHEQSSGIEQVNRAVMQMDEVTQQNAALVEEAASAAKSMEDQAAQLRQLMSFFKMSGSGIGVTPATGYRPQAPRPAPRAATPARRPLQAKHPVPAAKGQQKPQPTRKPEALPAKAEHNDEEWEEF